MNWRGASILASVLLLPLLAARCCIASSNGLPFSSPPGLLPSMLKALQRKRPDNGADGLSASAAFQRVIPLARRKRSPREEILYGTWSREPSSSRSLSSREVLVADSSVGGLSGGGGEILARLRNAAPDVLSNLGFDLLANGPHLMMGSGGPLVVPPPALVEMSKPRNTRNRHSQDMELWEKLVEMLRLKSTNMMMKRGEGPQLSVVSPLDVLRQQLIYEMARRRMKERQDQIKANDEFIKNMGKRSADLMDMTNRR